jgi:hypothetical protein
MVTADRRLIGRVAGSPWADLIFGIQGSIN